MLITRGFSWLEPQIVVLNVAGSSPVFPPKKEILKNKSCKSFALQDLFFIYPINLMENNKKLTRSRKERMIAGVCGGLAEYLGWDPTLVRIVYVLATIFTAFAGVIIYLILWIIMPEEIYSDGYGDRMNQRLH